MSIISINKNQIAELDLCVFSGEIHVIDSAEKAEKALQILNKQAIVGFDTETKPSFKKGKSNNVALIQIATDNECYLFRVNIIGISNSLCEFLENDSTLKIGLSLKDDFGMLNKVSTTQPKGFVDLQKIVSEYNIADASLQKIYAILFGKRISKSQRLSNWEADSLSQGQLNYASIDAWACLKIYNRLKNNEFDYTKSKYLITDQL